MSFVSANPVTRFAFSASARRTGVLKTLVSMIQLANERRALARLDQDALADIGISRDKALAEARRPVWDAPDYWHQ